MEDSCTLRLVKGQSVFLNLRGSEEAANVLESEIHKKCLILDRALRVLVLHNGHPLFHGPRRPLARVVNRVPEAVPHPHGRGGRRPVQSASHRRVVPMLLLLPVVMVGSHRES